VREAGKLLERFRDWKKIERLRRERRVRWDERRVEGWR